MIGVPARPHCNLAIRNLVRRSCSPASATSLMIARPRHTGQANQIAASHDDRGVPTGPRIPIRVLCLGRQRPDTWQRAHSGPSGTAVARTSQFAA